MCLNTFISKMSLFGISYQLSFLLLQSSNVKVYLSVLKLSIRGLQWGCLVFSASKLDSHWKKYCDFSVSRWSSGVTRTPSVYVLIEGSVKRLNPFSTDGNCENTDSISSSVLSWIFYKCSRETNCNHVLDLAGVIASSFQMYGSC